MFGKGGRPKILKIRLLCFESLEYGINILKEHDMDIWYWICNQYLQKPWNGNLVIWSEYLSKTMKWKSWIWDQDLSNMQWTCWIWDQSLQNAWNGNLAIWDQYLSKKSMHGKLYFQLAELKQLKVMFMFNQKYGIFTSRSTHLNLF